MLVLTVEGPLWVDKHKWSTHVVLGTFKDEDEVNDYINERDWEEEDILIVWHIESQTSW